MSVRAVFFDAGDTLLFRWTLKEDRFAWLCRQAGIPLPNHPERMRAGAGAHERFFQDRRMHADTWSDAWYVRLNQTGLAAAGVTGDLEALGRRMHEVALGLPKTTVLHPEAEAVLERLRGDGYRLAIVSNWDGTLIDELRTAGLACYFDAVLDSAVVGSFKPDARIFTIACTATGVRPEEAVHVGDSPGADVAGALAAGVTPVLLDPLELFGEGFAGLAPFRRIRTLADLPACLS